MNDRRHQNVNWQLMDEGEHQPSGGRSYTNETVDHALLMDIRDELQALRRIFECMNFQRIPKVLRLIAANTTKKKPAKLKVARRRAA